MPVLAVLLILGRTARKCTNGAATPFPDYVPFNANNHSKSFKITKISAKMPIFKLPFACFKDGRKEVRPENLECVGIDFTARKVRR